MNPDIISYIPHRKSMIFLDSIVSNKKNNFIVKVEIDDDFPIKEMSGVPSYCSIEMMAQAICAYNTCYYSTDQNPSVGFMIVVRNFNTELNFFSIGSILEIKVKPVLIVDKTGNFIAEVYLNSKSVASCSITAYVPSEEELLKLRNN